MKKLTFIGIGGAAAILVSILAVAIMDYAKWRLFCT
jgi:hypothetical protein